MSIHYSIFIIFIGARHAISYDCRQAANCYTINSRYDV